jgi:hypothetical protein
MRRPTVDPAFVQRLILAFTTGLFLSCAARISAANAAVAHAPPVVAAPVR